MGKFVYSFNEGSKDMRDLLGGKGANLAEMTKIGLPVPFGFTISTDACKDYLNKGGMLDDEIVREVYEHLDELEQVMGKKFGDIENPLLVSVRSGAPVSMPGMMDTILNLGLNDDSVKGLAAKTGNERFAYDSYRRFIQMFGDVVMEIPKSKFDQIFDGRKKEVGAEYDVDLKTEDLKVIIEGYKELVKAELGREFPQNPKDQLMEAIQAVDSGDPPLCGVEADLLHIHAVRLVQQNPITPVRSELEQPVHTDTDDFYCVKNLEQMLVHCAENRALPSELGIQLG